MSDAIRTPLVQSSVAGGVSCVSSRENEKALILTRQLNYFEIRKLDEKPPLSSLSLPGKIILRASHLVIAVKSLRLDNSISFLSKAQSFLSPFPPALWKLSFDLSMINVVSLLAFRHAHEPGASAVSVECLGIVFSADWLPTDDLGKGVRVRALK